MMRRHAWWVLAAMLAAGCATAPRTAEEREALDQTARATLASLQARDPTLRQFVAAAHGYAVFPSIGKGGLVVGGAYGRGTVYEQGRLVGFSDVTQATLGLQVGGQSFSQVIVFQTREAMETFKTGNFTFTGNASAVAVHQGAAAGTQFVDGVAVFIGGEAGLMAEAALGGQRFTFQAKP